MSYVMVQLNEVRNKLQDTFHGICELPSRKTESLGTELQRPRSAPKQIHRVNVPGQTVGYYFRPVFMPFSDHVVSQLNDINTHQDIDYFSSLLPTW
jgi:hypothetical protein